MRDAGSDNADRKLLSSRILGKSMFACRLRRSAKRRDDMLNMVVDGFTLAYQYSPYLPRAEFSSFLES